MNSRTDAPARTRRPSSPNSADQQIASLRNERPRETIPASTPSFTSFSHIRDPKERRAKEYEQHLLILRDLFPQYAAGIEQQIAYARSQQERGRRSDRARVIRQLEPCELSCREVAEDLEIPYATCYKILQELAVTGIVIIRQRAGRAGNKPVCYYSLSHTHKL
jgi:Trp operon repressor